MAATPYIGAKISLVSNADVRYEGTLYNINTEESTVALQYVRCFGTESRRSVMVPPSNEVYEYIIFRGKDIKDLTVCEPASAWHHDPAILHVNPPAGAGSGAGHAILGAAGGRPTGGRGGNHQHQQHQHPHQHQHQHPHQQHQPRRGGGGGGRNDKMSGGEWNPQQQHGGKWRAGNNRTAPGGGAWQQGGGATAGGGGRVVLGELQPQANATLKSEVATAFDFSGSNSKISRPTEPLVARHGYAKTSGFFDDLSCDIIERRSEDPPIDKRVTREKQRELDQETFGPNARPLNNRFRRGGPRQATWQKS